MSGGDAEAAARRVAMQVAAMRPQYVIREEVPAEVVENERRIAEADCPRGGQARAGTAQDRRRPGQRLLQGGRAARAASVSEPKRTVKALLDEAG